MGKPVYNVLLINLVGLLSRAELDSVLDAMEEVGSESCRISNETGKLWDGGFSDFYVMMLPDGSHTRDYGGEGVLTFLDCSYDEGYRTVFEVLRKYLTVDQLMNDFVLWLSW